ncbi:MAG: hypothetical protein WCD08_02750 [Steroidobacteraceae bacterium]
MGPTFFRAVEIIFTSYMVPALLVPVVWVAALIFKGRRRDSADPVRELTRQWWVLAGLFVLWLLLFLAVTAGAPLSQGGVIARTLVWMVYVVTNLLMAWFLLRFTSRYGAIGKGPDADRVFGRFLVIVLAQPLMTAAAFVVLENAMGVTWNGQVPELPAIQEGI